jgi:hypothetical protein
VTLLDSSGLLFGGLPFTRRDADDAGLPLHRLERMARNGLVRRMLRGVDAVICRRTAAWLYGVDALALSEHTVLRSRDRSVSTSCAMAAGTSGSIWASSFERRPTGRRLGLEYDSDEWHSGHERYRIDTGRRARLAHLGWDVLPVPRGDVGGRDPRLELAVGELLEIEPRLPRLW